MTSAATVTVAPEAWTKPGNLCAEQSADIDQLVIVGPNNPELVAEVVGPKARVILRDTNCSLLILRDR